VNGKMYIRLSEHFLDIFYFAVKVEHQIGTVSQLPKKISLIHDSRKLTAQKIASTADAFRRSSTFQNNIQSCPCEPWLKIH